MIDFDPSGFDNLPDFNLAELDGLLFLDFTALEVAVLDGLRAACGEPQVTTGDSRLGDNR